MYDQRIVEQHHACNRCEAFDRIEWQTGVKAGQYREQRARCQQQCITIGWGLCDHFGGNDAGCTRAAVEDHRLPEPRCSVLRDWPRDAF